MVDDWKKLQQHIIAAFQHVPRPDLDSLPQIGCCEEHEQDYNWYRLHTWQDFIKDPAHDPVDFMIIHPLAFHYFTPGVLSAAVESLTSFSPKYSFSHSDDETWITPYIPSPDWLERFREEYLPYFDQQQRQVIADVLMWFQQWHLSKYGKDFDTTEKEYEERSNSHGKGKNISKTISMVWKYET